MRMMIVGDTHGSARALSYKARLAQNYGCDRMFVVGDFGLWPGHEGVVFLDDVNAIAHEYNQFIFALPGNHENHDQWEKWLDMGLPTSAGMTYIRDRLLFSPKVHQWSWGKKKTKKRFWVVGGAVSIDKQWRTEGKSWWANETLSDEQVAGIAKYKGEPVDYLLTHDCSDHTPFFGRLKPDWESQQHRRKIDVAIKALRPRFQFHGHMHTRYEWVNTRSHGQRSTAFGYDDSEWNGAATKTYGLECNSDKDSWVILDTDLDKVFWPEDAYDAFNGEDPRPEDRVLLSE
jgi:predicted phosphodiesterase